MLQVHLRTTLARYGPSLDDTSSSSSSTTTTTTTATITSSSAITSFAKYVPPAVIESLSLDLLITSQELIAELSIPTVIEAIERLRIESTPYVPWDQTASPTMTPATTASSRQQK